MSFGRNMNAARMSGQTEARAIRQARDPSVLRQIGAAGVAAAIWQRKPMAEFSDWISGLPAAQLPVLRSLVTVGSVEACIHAACDNAGTPAGQMRDMFASDVAALAYIMSEVMGAPLLQLRLDVVVTDACRRFHVDNMRARMLCTYRGAGTQLAQPGQEHTPLEMAPGAAAILRGKLWQAPEAVGLLHRSPPISGTGQTRLLLVIDPAPNPQPDGPLH